MRGGRAVATVEGGGERTLILKGRGEGHEVQKAGGREWKKKKRRCRARKKIMKEKKKTEKGRRPDITGGWSRALSNLKKSPQITRKEHDQKAKKK